MPRMINMEPYLFPSNADMLMTGLPSVRFVGTPKYTHLYREQGCNPIQLCVPKVLADRSFHGLTSLLRVDQMSIRNLMSGTNHPLEITGGNLYTGRIWKMDLSEIASRHEPPGSRGPTAEMLDPHLNILDDLRPERRCSYLHQQRHWIEHIIQALGPNVPPDFGLHLNLAGFVAPVGSDTLPPEVLRLPSSEVVYDEGKGKSV
jgi:hypothetical protein